MTRPGAAEDPSLPAGIVPRLADFTGRKNAIQLDSPNGAGA